MPTLTDRITAGLAEAQAKELAEIDEHIHVTIGKLRLLCERRTMIKEEAQRSAEQVAARLAESQVAPDEEEQDAERFDGMS